MHCFLSFFVKVESEGAPPSIHFPNCLRLYSLRNVKSLGFIMATFDVATLLAQNVRDN